MAPPQQNSTTSRTDPWDGSTQSVDMLVGETDGDTGVWGNNESVLAAQWPNSSVVQENLWTNSSSSWSDCEALRLRCSELESCGLLANCTEAGTNCTVGNCLEAAGVWTNCTAQCRDEAWSNCTLGLAECGEGGEELANLTEFHIIKAVVLVAVTSVLLLSVCRMVLQLFVRYTNVKQDK